MTTTQRLNVLVVDGDVRSRTATARMLASVDSIDALAVSPQQALQLIKWGSPTADVALVDVAPDARSTEVVQALANVLPVVATSLRASEAKRALAAGACAFIEKDGDAASLINAVLAATPATRLTDEPRANSRSEVEIGENVGQSHLDERSLEGRPTRNRPESNGG